MLPVGSAVGRCGESIGSWHRSADMVPGPLKAHIAGSRRPFPVQIRHLHAYLQQRAPERIPLCSRLAPLIMGSRFNTFYTKRETFTKPV